MRTISVKILRATKSKITYLLVDSNSEMRSSRDQFQDLIKKGLYKIVNPEVMEELGIVVESD
jgi:hypothetical protein